MQRKMVDHSSWLDWGIIHDADIQEVYMEGLAMNIVSSLPLDFRICWLYDETPLEEEMMALVHEEIGSR